MLRANTGSSIDSDARAAGKEAAAKAGSGLDQVNLIFVYASSEHDLPRLLEGVKEALPGVPIIGGNSGRGVMLPEGYISNRTFVGAMAISDPELTVVTGQARNQGDGLAAGRQAAHAALSKAGKKTPPDFYHMTAVPGSEELYLKGLGQVIGRQPMSGLAVVDWDIMGDWALFTEDGVLGDGVAVAFFYTKRPIVNHFTGSGYRETDKVVVVTKMNSPRRLVELDRKPALNMVVEDNDLDPQYLTGGDLMVETALCPMGVKDCLGELTIIRYPIFAAPNGCIDLGANMAEKTAVIRLVTTPEELSRASAREVTALKNKMKVKPGAIHMASSFGRTMMIEDEGLRGATAAMVIKAAEGVPFIMADTLSEMGFEGEGMNLSGNLMLSYTGFAE